MKHARNYLGASMVKNVLLVVSIPLFTRWLTKEEYGTMSIFTSLVTLCSIIFGLNMRGGIKRYYLEKTDDFDRALGSNLIFVLGFNIVLLALVALVTEPVARFFDINTTVFFMANLVAFFIFPFLFYQSYLQAAKKSLQYLKITSFHGGMIVLVAVGIMYYMDSQLFFGKVYAELAITITIASYSAYHLLKMAKLSFDWKYVKYTLRFSLPLIPHAMSRYVLGYFDRIIIKQLGTATETGIYSFAYDVGMAMNVFVLATTRAWHPIFFEEYNEGNYDKINRLVSDYAGKLYFLAVAIIVFAREAVFVIADRKYYEALDIIPLIVIGYVFVFIYTLYFQYSSYRKRTELISLNTIIAGFANIFLNYIFIPIYGYKAAAATTLFSYFLLVALHFINAKFILKEKVIPIWSLTPGLLYIMLIAAVQMIWVVHMNYWLALPIKLGILGISFYVLMYRGAKKVNPE